MDGGTKDGRSALRHPLFWAALALLVINDHLLKGAGVLPGALTGKLSDFAGMIVAPVLLATAFGARRTQARLLAFAIAAAPFVAINVAPQAARGLEAIMLGVGIEWRIWTDPSDLVGLAMLPVAWWLLDAAPLSLPRRRTVEGTAMLAAAFACIATSPPPPDPETRVREIPPPDYEASAYLHNGSVDDTDVRLRWATGRFDCERVSEDPARYLSREAFGEGVTVTLDSERNFPLDRGAAGDALEMGADWLSPPIGACDAVLVQRDGSADTVVFFRGPTFTVPRHGAVGVPGAVQVGGTGDITGGDESNVIVASESRYFWDTDLCTADEVLPYVYSGERIAPGRMATVTSTELLRDGCFEVGFADETESWTSFLCVPMWAFDLTTGDTVQFDTANPDALFVHRLAADGRPATELRLVTSRTGYMGDDVPLPVLTPRAECGGFSACGAFTGPLSVVMAAEELPLGGDTAGYVADGRRYRVSIGKAVETVVGVDGCSRNEREPGMEINAVMLIEEAE